MQDLKTDTDAEREAHASLQSELLQQHPKHLPLLQERLSHLEKLAAKVGLGGKFPEVSNLFIAILPLLLE